ncbi:MAG: M14 family zinc carboxypeptidase [Thermoleophilaceae bacterium]
MRLSLAVVAAFVLLIFSAPAAAAPVATSEPQYQAYGAVFPDPLAVCQQNCDPNSRGQTNATQFIQWQEFNDAITFMNQVEDWRRYMEVLPLDGEKGEGAGTQAGNAMWPGNNLSDLEWTPKPEFASAGLATSDRGRQKSDLVVIRVTDENVPDKGKKRYALSLSIHGIERAGAEGGIRAMEEIVTAVAEGRGDEAILPKEVRESAPTWREVLANTIIYFTFPNPDGWRRGSVGDTDKGPGVFFQRYNGNGIDPNRDWPDIGFSFRDYSGGSEPETRAFQAFYRQVENRGGPFAAGDDLHGQPFADALSYTLMPHGRHDIDKDYRIREASKLINRAQYERTKWSPLIVDNDEEASFCEDTGAIGDACSAIYAQTWGSVYDTINYTTTGTLGDWFDSKLGLNADGIDNEMSFSHIDRNIAFDPQGEQLHVAGNKAIIYAHIADMLRPPGTEYSVPVKSGYVANTRLTRQEQQIQPGAPAGTSPQADIEDQPPSGADPAGSVFEFQVEQDADTFNGGMRVDVRASNVQGIGTGLATLQVQCKFCDDHRGVPQEDEWITVAEDFNQSFVYAQAGLTAAVNRPDARTGDDQVQWRALVSAEGGVPSFSVDFSSEPATTDGATGGDDPPFLAGYDVANTDFFSDLNGDAHEANDRFDAIDPAKVLSGEQSLDSFRTIVLADEALPGYNGAYKGQTAPTGGATADFTFPNDEPTTPGQQTGGCTPSATNAEATDEHPFTIGPNESNRSFTVTIEWGQPVNDWALAVFRVEDGKRELAGSTDSNPPGTKESLQIQLPRPGDYVIVAINCAAAAAADPFEGTVTFEAEPPPPESTYTVAQKDAWMENLRNWVQGGGNLVLTDGALKAVSELTSVPGAAISERVVYVGQTSFQVCETFNDDGTCETKETLDDPLSQNVDQFAARFNTGMRRQTFESTPLGFAIQSPDGGDASFARQFDIKQPDWVAASGRPVGGSADSGARDAQAVPGRTTLGELSMGQGKIRILGALLPQPSDEYDHPLGLEPYAVTYTGYILFCNLVDCQYERKSRPALPNEPAPPGPVNVGFGANLKTPLLASSSTRNGRRVPVRIRANGRNQIDHLQLQYRRTGRGTNRTYRKLQPRLAPSTTRFRFKKGKIGQTYLLRIRAHGKNGITSDWQYARIVFPYDDRGKKRQYSSSWKRVTSGRAWRGGYRQTSTRGATLRFRTRGGGRVYLIGRTSPNGGKAVVRARGGERRVVSFRSKRVRHRRVVAIVNRTDKRSLRFRLRVLRGVVTFDGLAVRRR